MAGRRHGGYEIKGNGGRRRPGLDTLKERIGKAADSRISPYKGKAVLLHAMEALGRRGV
jgi:hypothetical protein